MANKFVLIKGRFPIIAQAIPKSLFVAYHLFLLQGLSKLFVATIDLYRSSLSSNNVLYFGTRFASCRCMVSQKASVGFGKLVSIPFKSCARALTCNQWFFGRLLVVSQCRPCGK